MHQSNFYPPLSFNPTKTALSQSSPGLSLFMLQAELRPLSEQKVIQSPWTRGCTVSCYLGLHNLPSSFSEDKIQRVFIFDIAQKFKDACVPLYKSWQYGASSLLTNADRHCKFPRRFEQKMTRWIYGFVFVWTKRTQVAEWHRNIKVKDYRPRINPFNIHHLFNSQVCKNEI